jgi:hypothetical protein
MAATAASVITAKASLPTSSILPVGKAGFGATRSLSASGMFFFPYRSLADGVPRESDICAATCASPETHKQA